MAILPVGIRKEMKTQMFRMAQTDVPPEPSSVYMQTGAPAPALDNGDTSDKSDADVDIRQFITDMLVNELSVPQRIVSNKLDNLVNYSISSNGDVNGFFIIPVHTGYKVVSLSEAQKIVSSFSKKFSVECDIEHGKNFKVKFKTAKKIEEDTSDSEGSLKFIPDEKSTTTATSTKKVATSILSEQFEMRIAMLADTLKKQGYTK